MHASRLCAHPRSGGGARKIGGASLAGGAEDWLNSLPCPSDVEHLPQFYIAVVSQPFEQLCLLLTYDGRWIRESAGSTCASMAGRGPVLGCSFALMAEGYTIVQLMQFPMLELHAVESRGAREWVA